ncbi:protein kinase [Loktanella sp. IMCC34160]|uniref:serine/threonine-protein kinase n=1 Tax=Loktanella sp. IMCC34160 TaxID=2510646 RepID=UPI0013EC9AB1|nr:protein kinase [Loktanella sp. IMCC34160]
MKYKVVRKLGEGACGETIQLRDESMAADFVAKKYSPLISEDDDKELFGELFERFRDEARILFKLNHPNVVRVFNFYDYSEKKTAYILMEYVEGSEILAFLAERPSDADRVFEGIVEGFMHLQRQGVLHRDIRPANILVQSDGSPKIIDFGFGKSSITSERLAERKSISLNWWCETPPEFGVGIYDFQTEVYFVGKLFEHALSDGKLTNFRYNSLVQKMCELDRELRIESFQELQSEVSRGKFQELSFSKEEVSVYRCFADGLSSVISTVGSDARFERDADKITADLSNLYRNSMLEEFLPAPNQLVKIFVKGEFRYWTNRSIEVRAIQDFLEFIRSLPTEKRVVVVENIIARLEACERTKPSEYDLDDEIPF